MPEVDAARYRLRLLNAANARRFRLTLQVPGGGSVPLVQIGSDGGLLAAPVTHPAIDMAPGERFDVVIDLSALPIGTEVTMVNTLGEPGLRGAGGTRDVMRFRVVRTASDDSAVPARLAEIAPLVGPPGATVRTFTFTRGAVGDHDGWTINGSSFDPDTSLADSLLDEVEIWRFGTDAHHPVHVHLDPFQVLRRGARGPGPFDGGWKDTVDLRPGETVEVAVRFSGTYLRSTDFNAVGAGPADLDAVGADAAGPFGGGRGHRRRSEQREGDDDERCSDPAHGVLLSSRMRSERRSGARGLPVSLPNPAGQHIRTST